MDGTKKVVVIGTGVGGAGVAALLAAKGHEVTLLEKNAFIGGKPTGECIGLAQCVGQTGVHKPSPRTLVEGLWLVGTENAATSAMYVAALTGY